MRPEEEGGWALPHGEFGLDVIALVGTLRYQQQRSIPQIHEELLRRGIQMAQRTVTDQLYRYEELLALHLADSQRLQERLRERQQVILALDGGPPGCGTRSVVGVARLLFGRGASGTEFAGSHGERFGSAIEGSSKRLPQAGLAHRWSDHRWATFHPQRGCACAAWGSSPTLSLPLFAGSGQADRRRGSACEERTEASRCVGCVPLNGL
jgi:hypothetical protein